ncbi:MAG: prepilin-type N-terminal cleavage/methylation domain-containing protein [Clostridium chrysemydis]|uniref:prepilin-type N-terminal cleavage/methylation domain-containing protein n=1 Tax=Clostridium TaxID=1485 RepID=UPI0027E59D81|nr:prepilin-type N-terminal cleavage/methylation domain-containing protein [Clostridium sp. LY3-2]
MNTLKKRKKKGFTLIELIAVVAILAILAAVAVPRVIEYVNKSKRVAVQTTASTIYNAAEAAYNDGNLYALASDTTEPTTSNKVSEFGNANVTEVVNGLKAKNLIGTIDMSKLGTNQVTTMSSLEKLVNANQEDITVDASGNYTGLKTDTKTNTPAKAQGK